MNTWHSTPGSTLTTPRPRDYEYLSLRERREVFWMTLAEVAKAYQLPREFAKIWKTKAKEEFGR